MIHEESYSSIIALKEESRMSEKVLLLGGARSGKSSRAESLAKHWPAATRVYLATYRRGKIFDEEMEARVARHRRQRGDTWTTREVGLELPETLEELSRGETPVLVDCVTLWLASFLEKRKSFDDSFETLENIVRTYRGPLILVGNELGAGLVPESAVVRAFRDANGFLNQALARAVDRVEYCIAGLCLPLKTGQRREHESSTHAG
jgi:adenosylcobinamide kinase/adenosylcobinamide-phosphate guanylyltransferase